jgi:hypothetical protein
MEIWPILESSLKYGSLKKLDKGCVGLWNDVNPIDFIRWAQLKGYAIPEELKIIGTATQSETVDDACTVKPRKKLKPLERETNEGLLLIYGLCSSRKITYQDELIGIDAWGEIISGNFTSQHIKTYTDKSIIFNSGYKLNKTDFLEKYRKRFAIEE